MQLLFLEQNDGRSNYGMGLEFVDNIRKHTNIVPYTLDINTIYHNHPRSELLNQILAKIDELKIDILFVAIDHRILLSIEDLTVLNRYCFLVCYLGDDEHYGPIYYNTYCQAFDLILTGNYYPALKYQAMGLNGVFFPSSFEINLEQSFEESYEFDITFVGALKGKQDRIEYLNALKRHGYNVSIFGKDSDFGSVSRDEMYQIFRKSKINLNFTAVSDNKLQDINFRSQTKFKQIKGRCQEIALSGGFVLTEHAFGINKLFCPDKECVVFKDSEDLVEKCRFYLENDELRKSISKSGYEVAQNKYKADQVWLGFEKEITKLPHLDKETPKIIIYDRAFWHYFNAQILARSIRFFITLKLITAAKELVQLKIARGFDIILTLRIIKRELILFRVKKLWEKIEKS